VWNVGDTSDSKLNQRVAELFQLSSKWAQQKSKRPLPSEISRLSQLFTVQRKDRKAVYLGEPGLRQAYAGYFTPLNAAKIAHLLHRFHQEEKIPIKAQPPRVADLGSGPFSGLLGAWLYYQELSDSWALDRSAKALEDGVELWKMCTNQREHVPRWQRGTLGPKPFPAALHGCFDLVILGNVLNEIGDPRRGQTLRMRILENCLQLLSDDGHLLVLEPGTRVHGRSLQRIRDSIVRANRNDVLSPCPSISRCPLLVRDADWCHQELSWQRPESCTRLEKKSGLENKLLKCSHLLISNSRPTKKTGAGCLVGGLMKSSAGEKRYICQNDGIFTLSGKGGKLPKAVRDASRGETLQELPKDVKRDADLPRRAPRPQRRR
jgi:ribosomal protein RSM22 (predicted rRNA methylase)